MQMYTDRFCSTVGDRRLRSPGRIFAQGPMRSPPTVGELAEHEPLQPLPARVHPPTIVIPIAARCDVHWNPPCTPWSP